MKFFITLLSAFALHAQAVSWHIDPQHSSAQFSVKHMMISTVRGQFGGVKGNVVYDPKNPTSATVEATIDCSTVFTGEPKRDAQLKTAEFFDVKNYPVMKFQSKRVEAGGAGKLKVTGELTINAQTHQVVLELDEPSGVIKDDKGREKIGVSGVTKISRKEFGILYNPILETGGVAVSDEVSIVLEIELIKGSS
jgi:polyisoprenoid-binding protein YceI